MDFRATELHVRTVLREKQREAEAINRLSELHRAPRGLRATIAARLARLALKLDRETTGTLVSHDFRAAGHRS